MPSSSQKNERLAQALSRTGRGGTFAFPANHAPKDNAHRSTLEAPSPLRHFHETSSSSTSSSDQFRDVADQFEDSNDTAAPLANTRIHDRHPTAGSTGKQSIETTWDENEFQRQAADRSSRYSVATRYDGEGEADEDAGQDLDVDSRSTYGHARNSSVGSSIWAGRGVVSPSDASTNNKSVRRKPSMPSEFIPPLPTSSAAFQHFRHNAGPPSPALPPATDSAQTSGLAPTRGPISEGLQSAYTSPNLPVKSTFAMVSPSSSNAAGQSSSPTPHSVLTSQSSTKPDPIERADKSHRKTGKAPRRRSPVLSFDGAKEQEELLLNSPKDEMHTFSGPSGHKSDHGGPSGEGLERGISRLGPKVRKNEPAPWETDGDEGSESGSLASLPSTTSPQPQSAWSKLTRGSLDVRDREAPEGKRGLGLGVNLRRPSADIRRPSIETTRSREPSGNVPLIASNRESAHDDQARTPGVQPEYLASTHVGSQEGVDAGTSSDTLRSAVRTPSSSFRPSASPRPSDSVYTTASVASATNSTRGSRTRAKSVSASAANVLKGLVLNSDRDRKASEGPQHSNKLAKALKKKGEKNELSLAKGISSADYATGGHDTETSGAAAYTSNSIRAGANKNLVNPLASHSHTALSSASSSNLYLPQQSSSSGYPLGASPIESTDGSGRSEATAIKDASHYSSSPSALHETRDSSAATTDSHSNSSATGADVSQTTDSTSISDASLKDRDLSSSRLGTRPIHYAHRQLSPLQQGGSSPKSVSTASMSTPTRGFVYRRGNNPPGSSPSPSMGANSGTFAPSPTRQLSADSQLGREFGSPLSPKLKSMVLSADPSSTSSSAGHGRATLLATGNQSPKASAEPHPQGGKLERGDSGREGAKSAVNDGPVRGSIPHVHSTSSLPTPGSHEGVSYKLISLEQAQAQAKAKQQSQLHVPFAQPISNPDPIAEFDRQQRQVDVLAASGAHPINPTENNHATHAAQRSVKSKKSGILKGMFSKDKRGGDDISLASATSQQQLKLPISLTQRSLKDSSSLNLAPNGEGPVSTDNAEAFGSLGIPELGSIRPVSSMFASLSPVLLDKESEETASGADSVGLAKQVLEGQRPSNDEVLSLSTKPSHLGVARGHSPSAITPTAYKPAEAKEEMVSPGGTSVSGSIFHSPATSPHQLVFGEQGSHKAKSTSSGADGARASNEEESRAAVQPNGVNKTPSGNKSYRADDYGQRPGLAPNSFAPARSSMASAESANSSQGRNIDEPVVAGQRGKGKSVSRDERSSDYDGSGKEKSDAAVAAVKSRVCEIEVQIADLLAELAQLRTVHLPDVAAGSPDPSRHAAVKGRTSTTNDETSAPIVPSGPLLDSNAVPACNTCGCSCFEMKRLQAINETQVLKGLGSSVMDRGRGVRKRPEEAASRFGGR